MALLGRRLNWLPFSLATLAPPPLFFHDSHATAASCCCDIVRRKGFEGRAVSRLRAVPHQAAAFA